MRSELLPHTIAGSVLTGTSTKYCQHVRAHNLMYSNLNEKATQRSLSQHIHASFCHAGGVTGTLSVS